MYAFASRAGFTGGLSGGLYGSVGEHSGYVVFLTMAAVMLFVGGIVVALRDADIEASAALYQLESIPEAIPPAYPTLWPIIAAVAAVCAVVGLVISAQLFVFGVLVAAVVLIEWMVLAWSDRATGDPVVNRRIRNRLMNPVEVPVFGAIAAVVLVLCVSRVLLALTPHGSTAAALTIAVLVLGMGVLFAFVPKAGRTVVTVLAVVVVLGIITSGIIGAAEGSRNFEQDHPEKPFVPPDRHQPIPVPKESGG
jgi:hypothetical protein